MDPNIWTSYEVTENATVMYHVLFTNFISFRRPLPQVLRGRPPSPATIGPRGECLGAGLLELPKMVWLGSMSRHATPEVKSTSPRE